MLLFPELFYLKNENELVCAAIKIVDDILIAGVTIIAEEQTYSEFMLNS